MQRVHLSKEGRLDAIGMLQADQKQVDVADPILTSQSFISRLWARYRDTGSDNDRLGRGRVATAPQNWVCAMADKKK